jgi:hypothetical protein
MIRIWAKNWVGRLHAGSARRPGHFAPTDEVQVDVIHGLARVWTGVEDRAVTVRQPLLGGDLLSYQEQVPDQGFIILG